MPLTRKGPVHAEGCCEEFKPQGEPLEIIQLRVTLPAQYKMTKPINQGLQRKDIPELWPDEDRVITHIVFGRRIGINAPFNSPIDIHPAKIKFKESGKTAFSI